MMKRNWILPLILMLMISLLLPALASVADEPLDAQSPPRCAG